MPPHAGSPHCALCLPRSEAGAAHSGHRQSKYHVVRSLVRLAALCRITILGVNGNFTLPGEGPYLGLLLSQLKIYYILHSPGHGLVQVGDEEAAQLHPRTGHHRLYVQLLA